MKSIKTSHAMIVAVVSLFALAMTSCTSKTPSPAPAEKVVNLYELPRIYGEGEEYSFMEYEHVPYSWTDKCDSTFRTGEKVVETGEMTVILEGDELNWRRILGVGPNQEVVVRDIANLPQVSHSGPPANNSEMKAPASANKMFTEDFWKFLGWFLKGLLVLILAALAYRIIRELLAGGQWFPSRPSGPQSSESSTTINHYDTRNYYEAEEPNEVQYKGDGEHAMEFHVKGNFGWPLAVTVKKGKEDPTIVTFDRPEGYRQPHADRNHEHR